MNEYEFSAVDVLLQLPAAMLAEAYRYLKTGIELSMVDDTDEPLDHFAFAAVSEACELAFGYLPDDAALGGGEGE